MKLIFILFFVWSFVVKSLKNTLSIPPCNECIYYFLLYFFKDNYLNTIPYNSTIYNCTQEPCSLKNLTHIHFNIHFKSLANFKNVYAKLFVNNIRFPLTISTFCLDSKLKCPLEINKDYSVDVKEKIPNILKYFFVN